MNAIDSVYRYRGFRGCDCKCSLRIERLHDGRVVVICTELPDNPGTSITNFAEDLAGLVCTDYGIKPEQLVWIEHYPPDESKHGLRHGKPSWDIVAFTVALSDGRRAAFECPQWRPMREADWQDLGLTPPEDDL